MGGEQSNLKSENEVNVEPQCSFHQCERYIQRRESSVERRERLVSKREHSMERRERSLERRECSLEKRSKERIECKINILNGTDCKTCESSKNLSDDLQSMLDNEYMPDVDIRCRAENFKAHKCVLGARSSIFRAMFKTQMLESEQNLVVIEDIEPDVFRAFLSFLYSGQIRDLDVSKACALLHTADKYQVERLKQICADFLRKNLSVENCLDVLRNADLYDHQLKVDVLKSIVEFFPAMQLSQKWTEFQENNPGLSLSVYSNIVNELQVEKTPAKSSV